MSLNQESLETDQTTRVVATKTTAYEATAMRDKKGSSGPNSARHGAKKMKRLNAVISAKQHERLQAVFEQHGMKISEGMRIGLNIFAAALPVLAQGGELVFREQDGKERVYVFPFLTP